MLIQDAVYIVPLVGIECPGIPCEMLTKYSCDKEHGDNSHGTRIEQCEKWKKKGKVGKIGG